MSLNSATNSEVDAPISASPAIAGRSPRQIAWSRFKRNKVGMAAAGISIFLLSMSLFAPIVCRLLGINPNDLNLEGLNSSGIPTGDLAGFSREHPLGVIPGTGRDLLAQLLYGSRISFMIAILTTATALTIGFFVGIVGGYFRGRVDGYLGRFTDFLLAFPAFFMIVALSEPMVDRIEKEGAFPYANYAFDNGVLSFPLAQLIEKNNKQWVSELEVSRNIMWEGQWERVDNVAAMLRAAHPESFRLVHVLCRNGEKKLYWAFTKVVRLKKHGRKRLVIVHETEELTDKPRFLLSSAQHWGSGRIIETWNYRWSIEVFHEFSKQQTGLESAQLRNQEAVERHLRLSCVAQSILQRVSAPVSTSEKFEFANGKTTIGQKWRTITREIFRSLLLKISQFVKDGMSIDYMMEVLMPA